MEKQDLLQPIIEQVLNDIDFVDKLKSLSTRYDTVDEAYNYKSGDIIETCSNFDVVVRESKGEQFFSEYGNENGLEFRFGFTIQYNLIDFEFAVKSEKHEIHSGGSWVLLAQLMINFQDKINLPGFSNQQNLIELLSSALMLYRLLKKEVISKVTANK